jgi:hypothetical protein
MEKEHVSLERLKELIKGSVDKVCEDAIEQARIKAERAKRNSVVTTWNGCIDKQIERDKKLNDII